MNPLSKQAIIGHLEQQQLKPEERETEDTATSWVFEIAPNIQSELFCHEQEDNDLTVIMLTSVALQPSEKATTLTAALAPALAPAAIIAMDEALSLRLLLRGNRETIAGLIDEGIILSRHILASVCTRIVELADGKITLQVAMIKAMEALQGGQEQASA